MGYWAGIDSESARAPGVLGGADSALLFNSEAAMAAASIRARYLCTLKVPGSTGYINISLYRITTERV